MAYVSLTPRLEEFIQSEVKSGRYSSPSEVVREALRLLEEKKQLHRERVEELSKAIQAGADSGESAPLDMDSIIAEAEKRSSS